MKNTKNQNGFIPMMIMLVLIVLAVIWFVYERVSNAHN